MRPFSSAAAAAAVWAMLAGPPAEAQQNPQQKQDSTQVYLLEPLVVNGRIDDLTGTAPSASIGYVGRRDLEVRPLSREGELLETIPGMILTQHSGGGKANQMFVRGFNLDHGTDFETSIEGMPLNIRSHAHGQGYTDLNFLIPELVDHIEYELGNYYADLGDFGSAGGAQIRLRSELDHPLFLLGAGEDGDRRIVAAGSSDIGGSGTLLMGGEIHGYDGPWDVPEDLHKASGVLRYTYEGRRTTLSLLGLAYTNKWNSSDQVPLRAVESGLIDRFGEIDTSLGGNTSRYSLSGTWNRSTGSSSQSVDVYAIRYGLDLYSDFTYRLDDPTDGDQIRQHDKGRWTFGANFADLQPFHVGGREHRLTVGAQLRGDVAHVSLQHTMDRTVVSTVRSDDITVLSGGLYGQLVSEWTSFFRTTLGLREDVYDFDVTSDLPANTGTKTAQILSPKLSIAFGPWGGTELYVSGGLGFHSNDARGVVTTVDPASGDPLDPVDPLVRSKGAEIGVRSSAVDGLRSTLALWTMDLGSELLFVGDEGTNEASDASRRFGVTFANFYRVTPELSLDLDASFTRARFLHVDPGEDHIPGALENVIAAGISYEPRADGPFGAVRLRRFGQYSLIEDNSERASASSLVNVDVGYHLGSARLTLSLLNAFDARASDIEYYYASRLPGEPAAGVEDVHFHPAEPREVRVSLSWGM
jgi:TonB-dependent Receptor Plug Domain